MPSKTDKQHRAMEAAAHGKSTLGIPKKVGQDFVAADKKVVDHGDHFKVHTSGGSQFTIAKKGLHPATVKHIAKMCEGGSVPKYAEGRGPGDEAEEKADRRDNQSEVVLSNPAEAAERRARFDSYDPDTNPDPEGAAAGRYADDPEGMAKVTAKLKESNDARAAEDEADKQWNDENPMGDHTQVPNPALEGGAPGGIYSDPKGTGNTLPPAAAENPAAAAGAAEPQLQKHVAATVHDLRPGEIAAKERANAARTENAGEQERIAKETGAAQDKYASDMQQQQKDYEQHYEELKKGADQLRSEIANGKIDPNNYWHERGTGGRIMASLGLLLSGIGSGLGGGPNMAMKVIQDNIKRDIDAQEKNLETKKSLLQDYYRQTGDLRLSRQMAEHTLTVVTQAQMNKLAAQSSSANIKANAAIANAGADLVQEQQMRGISDKRSANNAAAKNLDITQGNQMMIGKLKAGGTKPISSRTAFQIGALRQAKAALDELERMDLSAGHAVRSMLTPGNRDKQNAEDLYLKYALESGKISKQGQPDKEEIHLIRSKQPGVGTSLEDAHKSYIKAQREWLKGQARGVSAQMQQEGYTDPFGDVAEWSSSTPEPKKEPKLR